MREELTAFCEGVNNTVWCGKVEKFLVGEEIDRLARKYLPKEYEKWEIEKAGLNERKMKIYVQVRFQGLIKTVVL